MTTHTPPDAATGRWRVRKITNRPWKLLTLEESIEIGQYEVITPRGTRYAVAPTMVGACTLAERMADIDALLEHVQTQAANDHGGTPLTPAEVARLLPGLRVVP